MYHRVRRKMKCYILLLLFTSTFGYPKSTDPTEESIIDNSDNIDYNVIDFDDELSITYNKKYDMKNDEIIYKKSPKYTVINDTNFETTTNSPEFRSNGNILIDNNNNYERATNIITETTESADYAVLPLELASTTENSLLRLVDSTDDISLAVIPLSTTAKYEDFTIAQSVTLPSSTQTFDTTTDYTTSQKTTDESGNLSTADPTSTINEETTTEYVTTEAPKTRNSSNTTMMKKNKSKTRQISKKSDDSSESKEVDVPVFTELDVEGHDEVPEDYYDSKDVMPTKSPNADALSVLFGLAGSVVESVVESVAERVVPKGIFSIFKRVQKQNEALEVERLRSREENGGLGQFGRGLLKSISSGLSGPISQLMAGVRDIGSLDNDRGFLGSLASSVSSVANVANSMADTFKDRVQAIYPGTVWCGDGHSPQARSGELGLFFFTDTCCRQHDACKIYIKSGETKYGLTNTGLFTRSHCSCDAKFRDCLRRTNSLVSGQIGLTYFNVLGPQCFRKAHPIVRCIRRTRITGQKCEDYELDYTKPKMWQWFDSETF